MDVPKDERGEILFSPTPFPTRAGRGDVPDDVPTTTPTPSSSTHRGTGRIDRATQLAGTPRPAARSPASDATSDASRRARGRRTTAPRAPRWPPNAPTVSRRNAMRFKPSSLAENSENNALYEARTAKAKAKKASDELSSRLAEFQRAQSKLAYVENQRRLERDLNEGVSMAETELLNALSSRGTSVGGGDALPVARGERTGSSRGRSTSTASSCGA